MIDPYLAQRDMDYGVDQNLREAEGRGLARAAGANQRRVLGRLMNSAADGLNWSTDRVRSAARAVQTWYDESVEPRTNAAG